MNAVTETAVVITMSTDEARQLLRALDNHSMACKAVGDLYAALYDLVDDPDQ